ncbi:hypothetical protein NUW58_g2330 [Xylaria curta]|uniref:Uncharacterized protein n=1 Tax=Xylaria curta TaxID=42375 RepID=A0ACC1PH19_9PEZI|nr:hypothetical protein NUW58_g2330 [Xylaria curta]
MSFNLNKLDAVSLNNWEWTIKVDLDRMENPPTEISNWEFLCPCQKRRLGFPVRFTEIHNAATQRSCRMCGLFEQAVVAVVDGRLQDLFEGLEDISQRAEILENIVVRPEDQPQTQQECYLNFLIKGQSTRLKVQLFQDAEDKTKPTVCGFTFPPDSPFGPGINPDRGFDWAKTCLSECSTHRECERLVPSRFPKRILDIQGDQVKVLKSTGSEKPYVSLSYRWGGPEHRRLMSTVRTLQDHEKGIPWTTLPKTFQDAVAICRIMEVKYLWIDALCILQQSSDLTEAETEITKADFTEENSIMASVYQGSHFTICADISTNMDSGIFSTGALPKCLPLMVRGDDEREATVYVRADRIYHSNRQLDIETRGWTFQEFLLPPRVLHFGEFDITWRCREVHICQCGNITGRDDGAHTWRERLAKAAKQVPRNLSEALEWWAIVLSFYQARKLSNGFDKLPALSGLAQVYVAATQDSYRAGLWERSLPHDLCWYNYWEYHNRGPLLVGNRAPEHRAPSWSWASINTLDGVTSYFWSPGAHGLHPITPDNHQRSVCVVHEVVCPPKNFGEKFDATGEVEVDNCKMEIGVKLISAIIDEFSQAEIMRQLIPWTLAGTDDGTYVQNCMPDCEMNDDGLKGGDKVYCAPIQEAVSEGASERGCLVLKRLEGQQYKRIGFCVLTKLNSNLSKEECEEIRFNRWGRQSLDLTSSETASKIQSYAMHFDPDAADRITIV